jgi:hypothetical protein
LVLARSGSRGQVKVVSRFGKLLYGSLQALEEHLTDDVMVKFGTALNDCKACPRWRLGAANGWERMREVVRSYRR